MILNLNPETFHQKFAVRDSEIDGKAAVMTGSANFTPTDMAMNLNHLVIVESKATTGVYQEEFDELWTGTFGATFQRFDPRPRELHVSKVRVKILFAPDHAPEMEIMKQMLKAKKRVDFAMFTFSNTSGIDDTMMVLDRSKIPVRGIIDRMQGNQAWAATIPLKSAGAEMFIVKKNSGVRKLHHKLMVIDEQLIIAGSFNYTEPANMMNDENIIIIGDLEEKAANAEAIANQRLLAQFALAEIDRIVTSFGEAI